jgi:hypothetical protein
VNEQGTSINNYSAVSRVSDIFSLLLNRLSVEGNRVMPSAAEFAFRTSAIRFAVTLEGIDGARYHRPHG